MGFLSNYRSRSSQFKGLTAKTDFSTYGSSDYSLVVFALLEFVEDRMLFFVFLLSDPLNDGYCSYFSDN